MLIDSSLPIGCPIYLGNKTNSEITQNNFGEVLVEFLGCGRCHRHRHGHCLDYRRCHRQSVIIALPIICP